MPPGANNNYDTSDHAGGTNKKHYKYRVVIKGELLSSLEFRFIGSHD